MKPKLIFTPKKKKAHKGLKAIVVPRAAGGEGVSREIRKITKNMHLLKHDHAYQAYGGDKEEAAMRGQQLSPKELERFPIFIKTKMQILYHVTGFFLVCVCIRQSVIPLNTCRPK